MLTLSTYQHKGKFAVMGLALALGACGSDDEPSARQVAWNGVNSVYMPTIAQNFAGASRVGAVNCIIANANGQEVVEIANATLLGSQTDIIYAALPVALRAETQNCVSAQLLKG